MNNTFMWTYFGVINCISGLLFTLDKIAAVKKYQRVPEKTLHLFEILGGVLLNIILMYSIRHKSKKLSYYIWSWLILIVWLSFIFFTIKY